MPQKPAIYRPSSRPGRPPEDRPTARARGYDHRWAVARLSFLADHPLCVRCAAGGAVEPATVVDHVTPHRGDPALFWDRANWQALCESCHNRKTASEDRRT